MISSVWSWVTNAAAPATVSALEDPDSGTVSDPSSLCKRLVEHVRIPIKGDPLIPVIPVAGNCSGV